MKISKIALIFFLLFKVVSFSYGWGAAGHNIIAEIAKNYIPKNIQDSVTKYLGSMTWESASTWMDDKRSNSQYDYMKQWHYVNIEKGMQYDSIVGDGNNVVVQLQKATNNLKKKSQLTKDEIDFNLKVLFHLIGDLHQPLHVGYGVDKGGNTIKVTFNGNSVNLHHLWDRDIIEYKNITLKDIQSLLSKLSNDSIQKISNGNVIEWMSQSRKLLDSVYSYTSTINDDYINKSYAIIENQLLFAGIRLGKELEDIFKK